MRQLDRDAVGLAHALNRVERHDRQVLRIPGARHIQKIRLPSGQRLQILRVRCDFIKQVGHCSFPFVALLRITASTIHSAQSERLGKESKRFSRCCEAIPPFIQTKFRGLTNFDQK